MRKNIISLILSILCCYPLASGNQPNVVLIISDDAGYADFGFMNEVTGNTTDILTPELDTLRSQGSLCSVAYTGAVCSPSRGSILTGSYQQRVGYFYNINNALDPADGPDGFANNEVIAFERMKSAGYKTLAIGKWHVGAQADTLNATGNKVVIPGNRPPRQGVDHFFGMLSGSRDYDVPMDDHAFGSYEYRQRGLREMSPGNKDDSLANDVDEEQNSKWAGDVTDAFGLRAREYVTEHANQDYPFFLYVAFNAPHTPMYESSDYDLLNNPNHPNYANFNSMSTVRKKYCSMVYTMDKNIGLLMDRLKDPNNDGNTSDSVYDNTLIIFINDNGGSKKNESVNLPLRGDKGDPHDGGCRVPMLMTGPGISGDSIYDKPIHSMDLIPTMLAHGGNSIPTELMGSNLLDRVKETDNSDPHDYICVAGNNGLGLRKGDWKLVIGTNGVQTLFNTSSDVGEANDLAGDEPAKLDELIKDATNFDVQMDKPRFPSKGSSHETLNYNYSFTFAPNEVTTPSGVDKILIDYDDGDANNGEHDSAVNNGGFESNTATSGNQGKFNQINQWTNLASNGQNINAIRDNNTSPNGGGWNAVLSDANPASKDFGIDTGHSLTAGENFTVDYAWLDASSWVDSDKIRFQLFTTNDNAITGTQNIIHTEDSSSSTNLAYKTENFTFTAPSGVDGKTLFLRFFALDGNASTGFARVDNIFVGRLGSDQTQTEPQFWAGSDQWQDPSSASDTLLVTDSCALSTLVFPAESNFDYIAQNNLTRYTGLEFIQNTLSFTGNGSNSGKTAKISGNDIILAENYTNDTPPSINFNGDGDGYTFDLALDILLYHDTVIEGDGTATYLISGELKDYDNAVSLTKNGSSTLTLAHDATYSGNTIINGGMLEINPGITLAGSPQVQVSAGASLSGNGSISGNVVGTGTLAPGQSIGTLAIAGDAQAGTLLIEIAANDADRMNVAGALDVSSMNLEITSLATPAQDTYIIASYGTLNGTFASITGVPNDYQILYTYDDSGSTNHIALAKINNVPNIDAIADQDNTTLDSVNLQASASDDDTADTLTFSATGLPAGLLINPSTGLISGTISSGAETGSAYSVVVTVTDNGSPAQSAEASFTWDVVAFNNAPTITPITTQTNITKDVVSLPINASDDVGDTLTYSASGLPSGLSINNASGLIFGTISDSAADASPYSITVIVTDNGSPTKNAQTSFAWNVTAFNNAPTITAISDQTGITKDVISLSVSASDSDGDTLSYIATGLPSGLSIDSSTGLISGTISDDAGDNSSYSVTITVTDDGAKSAQASFTWNVSTFNNAPTITAISDQTNITKDVVSLQVSALDSDDDTLSYIATGLPSGLSIDSSTGLISGTISDDAGDNSSYSVTITVTDDGAKSAQASFTWNVSTFNNAPTITAISDQTNITKDVVSLQVSALDSDDDTLSYIATGLPSGLSIDSSTGLISGTISDDAGDNSSYSVTITVTDDGAKSAQASFTWNVSTFNNAPTITAISDQTNITKDVVSLQVSALDSDDDTLSYIATGLPSGLSIDSSTGLISGTISDDAGDNSSYSVTITVTDDGAKSAQASFTWNVSTFNNAPTITAISDQTNITKDVVSLQVSALDSDDDTLSYIATGLPSGLSIDSSTGLISGTISDDAGDNSSYSVTITVTDDGAKSAQASFTWNVSTFNNAPTITAISDQTNITKDVVSIQVSALDSDDDTLSYSATGLPTGLSIGNDSGIISGTISDSAAVASPYSVTIIVADDGSPAKNAQTSFAWNVTAFNNAPTITAISNQTNITKDVVSIQVSALDSDDDTLSYIATGLPSGLSIDSSTGLISGTISDDAGDNSSYSVTITVTDDGAKSAQASFTWNVSTFNNAPTITAISDQTNITKDVVSLQVSALDSDDDTLSYIATGLPSGLSIDSSTGLISGTISDDAGDNSSYSVTITVTDDGAKSAQASFTWNVSTFNNAPTITAISDQTNITKDVVSIQVSALDSDDDTLSYSATGLPSGLSIDSSTGLISGTISDDAGDNSSYSVTITVTDDGAKSAQASFTWNVSTFNNAPTITAISDQTNITKDVVSLQVSALDSDDDTLSYIATGLPSGLSIDSSTGLISGTISDDAGDNSSYSVTITVTDDGAKSAQASFTWNVSTFNNAPTITTISDQTNITKDVVSIQVSALDSDDDTLSYSATGLPSGLSIDSSTGLISGTISDDAGDNSSYSVTITVTDDGAKSAQASFTWNVSTFNNAPTIDAVSDQTSLTKDVISLATSASDSDGDTLSYNASGLPSGLSIGNDSGIISGTIADDAAGSSPYSVTVTVTDNGSPTKNAETSLAWVVNSPPDTSPPTADLTSPANDDTITTSVINAQGYLEVTFVDTGDGIDLATIDGDELSLSGTGLGTAILVIDEPTLVSGSTYRYGFNGNFVEGTVNVDFIAGSFADLAEIRNTNTLETESFVTEDESAPAFEAYIDFGTKTSPVAAGYTRVTSTEWIDLIRGGTTDRAKGSDLERDLIYMHDGTYTLSGVTAGTYDVTLYIGDLNPSKPLRDANDVYLQGVLVDNDLDTPSDTILTRTYSGIAVDGSGELILRLVGLGGSNDFVLIAGMDVVASGPSLETLTVTIADASIGENGGSTTATVTRSGDTTSELVVNLSGNDTTEATVPTTVTIVAGQTTSPEFTITAVDDTIPDGTQTVMITASVIAGGYSNNSDTLDIADDESAPAFEAYIDFGTKTSPVAAGYTRVTSTEWIGLIRGGTTDRAKGSDLERDLIYMHDGTYTLSGVTAGTYDVTLYIGDLNPSKPLRDANDVYLQGVLVDNDLDTPSDTILTRTYSGIAVDGSGELILRLVGLGGSNDFVLIAGMDVVASGPSLETLTVTIADASIGENGGSTTATVTRSGDTTSELVVNLSGNDTTEATVPTTVTIVAGQTTSPEFTITAVDDTIPDGTQTVMITASVIAGGYSNNSDTLDIADDESAPAFEAYIDFGTKTSPVAAGYTRVTSTEWIGLIRGGTTDRAKGSDLERDLIYMHDGTYTLSGVTAGTYDVTLYIGDLNPSKPLRDANDVYLQGVLVDNDLDTPSDTILTRTYSGIAVDDSGELILRLVGLGGSNDFVLIAGMDVVASGPSLETLTVTIADASIGENGGSTTATVTRSGDTTSELVVNLSGNDTTEATVPTTVTIVAGQTTSPEFTITAVDDTIPDGTQTVMITASVIAGGYSNNSDTLDIADDESAPAFEAYIDFGTKTSPVAAGYTRVTSTEWIGLIRGGTTDRAKGSDLERDLIYMHDGTYTLSGVTAGTYDVTLYIGDLNPSKPLRDANDVYLQGVLVDNDLDTPSDTILTRTYSGIAVDGSGELILRLVGLGGSNDFVLIAGMDVVASGPSLETLTVTIADASIGENGGSTTATVTRSGDTTSELVVNLSGNDTTEATVPTTVTIVAGQTTSPEFTITAVDDTIPDGTQTVMITASVIAGGYSNNSDTLDIADDESAPAFEAYIDFGTKTSPVAAGYTRVTSTEWIGLIRGGTTDRAKGSDLERDLIYMHDGTYTLSGVTAGTYDVTLYIGDLNPSKPLRDANDVYLQGVLVDNDLDTPSDTILTRTYSGIAVDDSGELILRLVGLGGSNDFVLIAGMDVVAVNPTITSAKSLSESSLTDSSAINIYNRYQLASGVLAGTSVDITTTTDSDSDGMADHEDLFPDNPNLTKISDYINYIADYIADDNVIFAEDWKEQDHNTQFTAHLEAVLELVFAAEAAEAADQAAFFYLQAFERVDEKLIPRTDGFQEGGSHETDWIIIKEAQDIVYPDLLLLSEYLWLSTR